MNLIPERFHYGILLNSNMHGKFSIKVGEHELRMTLGSNDDHFILVAKGQFEDWEKQSLRVWESCIEPDSIVIDVGSYLGIYSILASKRDPKKIYSFEPNPRTREKLYANLEMNDSKEIQVIGAACGSTAGVASMEIPNGRAMSSGARIAGIGAGTIQDGWDESFQVDVVVIDQILPLEELNQVSIMKIDAEGFELQVLEGCVELLNKSKPKLILEILSDDQFNILSSFLKRFGYTQFVVLDIHQELIYFELDSLEFEIQHDRNFLFI